MTNADFAGLRVAAFESRRAPEMARLIERHGGVASVSPSMREVPVSEPREAIDFAHRLMSAQIDVVVLLTGVGTRQLVAQIERHVDRARFLGSLADVTTIVRGPKPLAALKEFEIEPTFRVPEPNTWREVLRTIDEHVPIANLTVALQEYGLPNASLVAGLEARGAKVVPIKVYHYDLPEDTGPLESNIRALAAGQIDIALFTSAHQVVNLLRLARQLGLADDARAAFRRVVVASIGPTTSEMLAECGLPVDLEPEHAKMGHLVQAAARRGGELLAGKRARGIVLSRVGVPVDSGKAAWHDGPFMRACRREPCDRVPIWLMRQAGRYMREYRQVREKTTFLDLCKNPALAAEVMIAAVARLGVDAAIIFSDLLPMLEPMGIELEFSQGEGPVIHNPLREAADVERLRELEDVERLEFVFETVRLTRAGVASEIPVIGFAGAPFTLASYIVEGGASRNYLHTKTLMYRDEAAWHALMARLARAITRYLNAQIAAGAQAVQLFDSWVGCLGPDDYRNYVLPHSRAIVDGLSAGAALIHFATGNPALLPLMAEAGGAVIGIDWRIRLDDAWRTVGYDKAVQGNLDPMVLLAQPGEIRRRARAVLQQAGGRPGHIFNLGHGIVPQTPLENVIALVEAVHELGPQIQ
ncbi:MAG TPA: uroporphyrinogen decarboxylase [Pirellulales bacterium]|jgi:uroporphyrinogen decarboxylase|nr:uroporphyrinogen decarboxylase [Pirellulales bacterium]